MGRFNNNMWDRWNPSTHYGYSDFVFNPTGQTLVTGGGVLFGGAYANTPAEVNALITDTVADLTNPGAFSNWTALLEDTTSFPCMVQFVGLGYGSPSAQGCIGWYTPSDMTSGRGFRAAIEIDGTTVLDGYVLATGSQIQGSLAFGPISGRGGTYGWVSIPFLVNTSLKIYAVREGNADGTGTTFAVSSFVKVAD